MEGTDRTFLEPFVVLSAVAAVTERITLGTGSIIPHRHPIYTAQILSALSTLSAGRLILGFGAGGFEHEFAAIGMGGLARWDLVREQVAVLRSLATGEEVTHEGAHYRFTGVNIRPRPVGQIPVWYCGGTPASTRYAIEYCDGWMPGRITYRTYQERVSALRRMADEHGRSLPTLSAIPITSPGRTREEALAKVNLAGLLKNANGQRFWIRPPSGEFRTADDLAGSFVHGSSQDIVEQIQRYQEIGMDHLVFDLRFRFDEYAQCLAQLGEEVLPKVATGR
jgi:alkanesulfonate monooxygenase SsuD/methylene tetrahydromethanopterin reductase-like flavin-dependent oxidoreductase (luciferase family)